MHLENLHPDFCLSNSEMQTFINAKTEFTSLQPSYCRQNVVYEDGDALCGFYSMDTLPSPCRRIISLSVVTIGAGDEQFVWKLSNISSFEGPLAINNTTLTNVTFLDELVEIEYLNSELIIFHSDKVDITFRCRFMHQYH